MKPSISRPLQIAFATSPPTVAIMREDGFVCPPTEPTSALMTERVSLMSISPIRAAQHLGLGACCAGHGAAHSRTKTSVAAIGSTHPVHPVAGIMQSFALGTVTICCAARVRLWHFSDMPQWSLYV